LMNGTPIVDIKPYVRSDCRPEARFGFTDTVAFPSVQVEINEKWAAVAGDKLEALRKVLAQKPIPAYHDDPSRVYGMSFAGMEVKFRVDGDVLTVEEILI